METRARRIKIGQAVQLRHNKELFDGTILNVSYGGILISSELKLGVGDKVTIIHETAGELKGSVPRVTEDCFAVFFDENESSATFALNSITSIMFAEPQSYENGDDEVTEES
jgi:hypothetical protein